MKASLTNGFAFIVDRQPLLFILKPLLHNDTLFNLHHKVFKETMLEVITINSDKAWGSSDILQTLGVESVAKQ
jgi:hypothetical protein